MAGITSDSRTKLEAAQISVQRFLNLLDFAEGDRAAVVSFDAVARVLQPLTEDHDALLRALDGLRVAEQTCLPCEVELAVEALGPRFRREENAPVLILLTDGRSNPRPPEEAVIMARRAHAEGVTIFSIGLGDDLDADALTNIASKPSQFYQAASARDLVEIYERIAVDIPCLGDRVWGKR